jgi:hypothetical protein
MIRFVPDTWWEGVLRPLLLADPVASLYVELHAPDLRFAALVVLLLLVLAGHRSTRALAPAHWQLLSGLAACFYLWTFLSGNGRYVLWLLLLAGPLVVLVAGRLKATLALRNTVLLGLLALQLWLVSITFEVNAWALRPWKHGPGLALAETPLKHEPAVFVTIGTMSHSILVPQFHPQSRWANAGGQHEWVPGSPEQRRFAALLASPLPSYAVVRASKLAMTPDRQPVEHAWVVIRRSLAQSGLVLSAPECQFVATEMGGPQFDLVSEQPRERGFWFCPIRVAMPPAQDTGQTAVASELDDVFARLEQRCPRMFPPGNSRTRLHDDGFARAYNHSDIGVVVNHAGYVYFRHIRAINPTELGSVSDVRAGRFEIDCQRIPGRYQPPWTRPS